MGVMVRPFYRNGIEACVGSIPHESNFIMKSDKWIRPAPRASGLRLKRRCGIRSSYDERQNKIKK
jgi:hypothetical protein